MNQGSGARSFSYTHDFNSGLLTSIRDNDHGGWMRAFQYDDFGRLKYDQEASIRGSNLDYSDSLRQITERRDLNSSGDRALLQYTWFDQVGKVKMTQDPAGNQVLTRHLIHSTGNYEAVSNPHVTGSEPTMGWTRWSHGDDQSEGPRECQRPS